MPRLLLCLLLLLLLAGASAATPPRVLMLNSYHPQFVWTAALVEGARAELKDVLPPENLHIEYMDARRFIDDAEHERRYLELLHYRYARFRPDLVLSTDDAALDFLLKHRQTLWPGTPIVFCGVNILRPQRLNGLRLVTGIEEGMEIEGNLSLIKRMQPELRRLVLLADRSSLGRLMTERAREVLALPAYRELLAGTDVAIWDEFTLQELEARLAALPEHSAVLMLAIHRLRDGQYFSYAEQLPPIAERSPAPIYGMWGDVLLGQGIVGGYTNDGFQHGRAAAVMARRILAGAEPLSIPIESKAEYLPRFDYPVLERLGLDLARLPPESIVLRRPVSYYAQHRLLLNSAAAIIAGLVLILVLQQAASRRTAQAKQALAELNAELEERVRQRTEALERQNAELERLNGTLANLAHTDTLTGLPNRREAERRLERLLKRKQQDAGHLALALLDIDHFKHINDDHGHEHGDFVLQGLARLLPALLRPTDLMCRWGGEEFLLLFPDTEPEESQAICERLRAALMATDFSPAPRVSASFGLTSLAPHDSQSSLLKRADMALYRAKDLGRNRVEFEPIRP
ncbi:MAG: diguanylate cyclase [Gammaproteobacteria bacterium]|nr:diguanylate cyclase [Gammaproteobacteria bacterium]